MTGLHVYCLLPPGAPPPPDELRGVAGAAVDALAVEDLALWCSRLPRRPRAGVQAAQDHDRVIRAALAAGVTPLPFRFGQWAAAAGPLRAELRERLGAYRAVLDRVRGTIEFSVRIHALDPAPGDPAPTGTRAGSGPGADSGAGAGTSYLRALARRNRAQAQRREGATETLRRLDARLVGLLRESRVDRVPARGSLASASHLLVRDAEVEYRSRVDRFAEETETREVRVTGPWPPYSFAEVPGEALDARV